MTTKTSQKKLTKVKSLFENQMENLIFATQFVLSKNAPKKNCIMKREKNAFGINFGPCYMPKPCPLTFICFFSWGTSQGPKSIPK